MDRKVCAGCAKELPHDSFTKSKRTRDGLESKCKTCRQEARKKYVRKCDECGTEFRTAKKATLCSQKCVGARRTKNHNVIKQCATCGVSIKVPLNKVSENNYCSSKCFGVELGRRMTGERVERVSYTCDNCGNPVYKTQKRSVGISNHYCDMNCFSEGIGKHRRNPNLPHEIRVRRRSLEGYKKWRTDVLARSGGRCVKCGDSNKLHAHHIINYSDNFRLALVVENGVALCEECHRSFHSLYGNTGNDFNQLISFILREEVF